jgi:hypothetical protein
MDSGTEAEPGYVFGHQYNASSPIMIKQASPADWLRRTRTGSSGRSTGRSFQAEDTPAARTVTAHVTLDPVSGRLLIFGGYPLHAQGPPVGRSPRISESRWRWRFGKLSDSGSSVMQGHLCMLL